MELNYKLITKEQLPTEARVSFAIRNTEFYCWLLKDQLLINAEAPQLDLVLDALRIYWMYEVVDWEEDMKVDAACKIIKQLWTSTGSQQVFDAWYERVNMERTMRRQAWAMEVLSRYGGQKGLDILDAMEDDDSYLYDTLYSVATKQSGSKQGWNDFIKCAYLYAYNKGMEAAQRAAG